MTRAIQAAVIAALTAVATGFSVTPYGWAHIASSAITAGITSYTGLLAYNLKRGAVK